MINKHNISSRRGLLLVRHHALGDHLRDLDRQPRPQPQGHGVGDAELWRVPSPERLEVVGETDLAAAVHLGRFAVQLGEGDLGGGGRVGDGDVELDVELIFEEVVDVPAFAWKQYEIEIYWP